jgi:calcineurin-like phosphoesterase family protein
VTTNYWFTSDTHYFHSNIIKHSKRPQYLASDFDADGRWVSKEVSREKVQLMNEMLIENHNKVVKPNDLVFHLGDFCFSAKAVAPIRSRLNGRLHLVAGNHDKFDHDKMVSSHLFDWVKSYHLLRIDNQKLILCHFPFVHWDGSYRGSFHLHGHCHGNYKPKTGRILDVGVDCQGDYRPWNYDEIAVYMRDRIALNHHDTMLEEANSEM